MWLHQAGISEGSGLPGKGGVIKVSLQSAGSSRRIHQGSDREMQWKSIEGEA